MLQTFFSAPIEFQAYIIAIFAVSATIVLIEICDSIRFHLRYTFRYRTRRARRIRRRLFN